MIMTISIMIVSMIIIIIIAVVVIIMIAMIVIIIATVVTVIEPLSLLPLPADSFRYVTTMQCQSVCSLLCCERRAANAANCRSLTRPPPRESFIEASRWKSVA